MFYARLARKFLNARQNEAGACLRLSLSDGRYRVSERNDSCRFSSQNETLKFISAYDVGRVD